MEFARVVQTRRMVRAFTTDPVDDDQVRAICDAGRRAPSAGFAQGVRIAVLDGARFFKLSFPGDRSCFGWPGVFNAPRVLVPLVSRDVYMNRYSEPDKSSDPGDWDVPYWWVDAGMVIENCLLAVTDAGLGAVFFRLEEPSALMESLGMDGDWEPAGAIAIGHPSPDDRPSGSAGRGRIPYSEFVIE